MIRGDFDNRLIAWSSRRLIYEACKHGIKNNCTKLDLGIVNMEDPLKKGIVNFKLGFTSNLIPSFIYRYGNNEVIEFIKKTKINKNLYIH